MVRRTELVTANLFDVVRRAHVVAVRRHLHIELELAASGDHGAVIENDVGAGSEDHLVRVEIACRTLPG